MSADAMQSIEKPAVDARLDMTDYRIEVAARELCRLRGVDPDVLVYASSFVAGCDVAMATTAWREAADEIRRHLLIDKAIGKGLAAMPTRGG